MGVRSRRVGTPIQTLTPLSIGRSHSVTRSFKDTGLCSGSWERRSGRCVPEGGGLEIMKPFLSFYPVKHFEMDGPAGNLQKEFPAAGGWVGPGVKRKSNLLGQAAGPEATCMSSWSWEGSRGRARRGGKQRSGPATCFSCGGGLCGVPVVACRVG